MDTNRRNALMELALKTKNLLTVMKEAVKEGKEIKTEKGK